MQVVLDANRHPRNLEPTHVEGMLQPFSSCTNLNTLSLLFRTRWVPWLRAGFADAVRCRSATHCATGALQPATGYVMCASCSSDCRVPPSNGTRTKYAVELWQPLPSGLRTLALCV